MPTHLFYRVHLVQQGCIRTPAQPSVRLALRVLTALLQAQLSVQNVLPGSTPMLLDSLLVFYVQRVNTQRLDQPLAFFVL